MRARRSWARIARLRKKGFDVSTGDSSHLVASPGDRLVIRGHHQGEPERDGEILKVLGESGGPPFLVRWEDGHEAEVFPGSDAYVQHLGETK
jgi:hypothetical protein